MPLDLVQQGLTEERILKQIYFFLVSLSVNAHILKCSGVDSKASDDLKLHFRYIWSWIKTLYTFSLYILMQKEYFPTGYFFFNLFSGVFVLF